MTARAIIFDMDDLMIDSHPAHMEVFEAVLQQHGASLRASVNPLTREEEVSFFGRKITDILALLRERYRLQVSVEEMNAEFNRVLLPVFAEHIAPMPGLSELIASLKEEGFRLVLASSASRKKIGIVLRKLGLGRAFEAMVSGEDEIEHGKPAPDIFLAAAQRIGVAPEDCLVLEDAKNGVEAAKAAGMSCIGVHNSFAYERLGIRQDLSAADIEVQSLREITPHVIKAACVRDS